MIQSLRVIRIGWLLQLKTMARSGFDVLTAIVTPITYATIAFFLYGRGGGEETLLWVSLVSLFGNIHPLLFDPRGSHGGRIHHRSHRGDAPRDAPHPEVVFVAFVRAALAQQQRVRAVATPVAELVASV